MNKQKIGSKKRDFKLDFDVIRVVLPDDTFLEESIDDHLLLNQDLPADILDKMAHCASTYARWGSVLADMDSYLKKVKDEYSVLLRKWKNRSRSGMSGKPAEGAVEEKAVLDHIKDYLKYQKTIRLTERAIDKIKRLMKAFEMQAELSRSISSYTKKEMELADSGATIIGRGTLKKRSDERKNK